MGDLYAVIGNPIKQSKSPVIHSAFAKSTHQNITYTAIEGGAEDFVALTNAFQAAGGRGLNVTAPFKIEAYAYVAAHSPRAELAGAVNAIKFQDEQVIGENFDGLGLVRDLVCNLQQSLRGKRILLMGAGGATRGSFQQILAEGPSELVIADLFVESALTLASLGSRMGSVQGCDFDALRNEHFDVVINATSASLRGELPPVPASIFKGCEIAYELAYGLGLTPFLKMARDLGVTKLADGVGMLAEQAAESFAWWRGIRPDTKAVIDSITVPLS